MERGFQNYLGEMLAKCKVLRVCLEDYGAYALQKAAVYLEVNAKFSIFLK
jgi:hypothetical protein